jgi:glycosyltransferase involved in cell wall biosynthesis
MRICLISVEIFGWNKIGGFGRSTRMLGRELVRRGIEVSAVVPRRAGQAPVEEMDGIRVYGFTPNNPFSALNLFRMADADVYHSQEPSFGTYLAQLAMPDRKHVVTFRDTRFARDWWIELCYPSLNYLQVFSNYLYEDNFLVSKAVRRADGQFVASKFLIPRARKKYNLNADPEFLPSPIQFLPEIQKSATPLVCFVGRLDRRKRPQIFYDLARQFPQVNFVSIGTSRDVKWEERLREEYANLKNLEMRGFINQFASSELFEIMAKSWVLVNTSARESLPTTFIEAAAHGCAILSEIDPDGFASRFGKPVTHGDYANALQSLLQNEAWRTKGLAGMEYTREHFSLENSIRQHLEIYEQLSG